MSFYNVANPTQFYIYKQDQFGLVDQGKIVRIPSTQLFTGAATTANFSLTANQLINGNLIINAGATGAGYAPTGSAGITVTLPSATDLITLLMGPAGFDISTSDVFTFSVQNTASGTVRILPGTDGTGSAISITAGSMKFINFQITISTVAGVTTYSYALL
jgi:hypothetical protein